MRPAATVLALCLAACSGGADPGSPAALHPEGAELYRGMGCLQCHGAGGAGGSLAPPLEDLAAHWTREEIARYLADPVTYVANDARLSAIKRRYGMQMPALTLPEEQRLQLADYVLALSASAE